MVVLKKVKASTLMETLVATVLLVVVFMIASMILNNLFSNTIKSNTRAIEAHLKELEYLYINKKLDIPYQDDFKSWEITIQSQKVEQQHRHINHQNQENQNQILFEAINIETRQTILKTISEN